MTSFKMAQKMQTVEEKISKKMAPLKPQDTQNYELLRPSLNTANRLSYALVLTTVMCHRPFFQMLILRWADW